MRGSLRSWSALVLLTALGACSNIIGVSDIEIDPSLDAAGSGGKGDPGAGGKGSGGSTVLPQGGDEAGGTAGSAQGGKTSGGTDSGGTDSGGTAGVAGSSGGAGSSGEAGMGGEPPVDPDGCEESCDDEIACTEDSCVEGECVHVADDTFCEASSCETCRVGIGCVATGTKTTQELLADNGFDLNVGDWDDQSPANIVVEAAAVSAPHLLKLGPAAPNATKYLYADVYQWVTVPDRTVGLSLSVSYQFAPGAKNLDEEYAVIALYLDGDVDPFTQFHEFEGGAPAQPSWKTVSYAAAASDVALMSGLDFSLDFVAHSFDGVYRFDNVKLTATVCE